jgi:hypothetical protein
MMASMAMGGTDAVVGSLKPMLAGFGKELVNAVRVGTKWLLWIVSSSLTPCMPIVPVCVEV